MPMPLPLELVLSIQLPGTRLHRLEYLVYHTPLVGQNLDALLHLLHFYRFQTVNRKMRYRRLLNT